MYHHCCFSGPRRQSVLFYILYYSIPQSKILLARIHVLQFCGTEKKMSKMHKFQMIAMWNHFLMMFFFLYFANEIVCFSFLLILALKQ